MIVSHLDLVLISCQTFSRTYKIDILFLNLMNFIVFHLFLFLFFIIFRGNNANVMIIPTHKLHSQVDSFSFNDETDVLIGTYVRTIQIFFVL